MQCLEAPWKHLSFQREVSMKKTQLFWLLMNTALTLKVGLLVNTPTQACIHTTHARTRTHTQTFKQFVSVGLVTISHLSPHLNFFFKLLIEDAF